MLIRQAESVGIRGLDYAADKAYPAITHLEAVKVPGGRPFCPPPKGERCNRRRGSMASWLMMKWFSGPDFWTWKLNYDLRTAIERAFSALKAKLTDEVASKNHVARVNEALLMVLAFNIMIIIRLIHDRPEALRDITAGLRREAEEWREGWGEGDAAASALPAFPPGPDEGSCGGAIALPPPTFASASADLDRGAPGEPHENVLGPHGKSWPDTETLPRSSLFGHALSRRG